MGPMGMKMVFLKIFKESLASLLAVRSPSSKTPNKNILVTIQIKLSTQLLNKSKHTCARDRKEHGLTLDGCSKKIGSREGDDGVAHSKSFHLEGLILL